MSLPAALAVCLLLMVLDLVARSWRLVWLVRGVGQQLAFREAVVANAFGDAASALTPGRLGGEPARLAGMLRAGLPAEAGLVTISFEIMATWPVVILFAGWLSWMYAPEWLTTVAPQFFESTLALWPWLLGVVALTLAAAWWARRTLPWARVKRPVRRIGLYWRRMPPSPILASIPMTLVNLVTRTAILPVLAMALPDPPAFGPMMLGSFALLYSQLVLPTPAGVGGVEFGFLAGAAGTFSQHEGLLLLLWRFFTVGFGVLLGGIFLVRLYGWPAARRLLSGHAAAVADGKFPDGESS